jgi:hypothetical protein
MRGDIMPNIQAAQEIFTPDFDSPIGAYFKGIKFESDLDTEMVKDENGKLWPSGRRWVQFLDGAGKIIPWYLLVKKFGLRLDIIKLAKKYGCTVEPFCELSDIKDVLALDEPEYKVFFEQAAVKGNEIDGVTFPKEKKIFYKKGISEDQMVFLLGHELSHCLLDHQGAVLCKKTCQEAEKRNEEADKLAAILLMPHDYIKSHMDEDNNKLAQRFGVPVKAVEKRKEEVQKEVDVLCYGRR